MVCNRALLSESSQCLIQVGFIPTTSIITFSQDTQYWRCAHSSIVFPKPRWDYQDSALSDLYYELTSQNVDNMSIQWLFTFIITELLRVPVIVRKNSKAPYVDLHDAYAPLVNELVSVPVIHKVIS